VGLDGVDLGESDVGVAGEVPDDVAGTEAFGVQQDQPPYPGAVQRVG
jgi:hypothetical protein